MTWKRSTRRSFCLLVTVLLVSCATPATRSDLTPTFSGLTSSHITIGVVDSRPYVISGNKEPWFEGIVRGGFGIPYTFNRPDRPPNETFADRIAKMLERTFTDAGSQVTVVRLARGSTQPAARGKLKPQTKDVALLIRIHDSKFDAGGFQFDYPYHFQLSVLDPEGNTLAQASVQGRDAHTPSSKYNVWDMYGVVYRDKLEQLLVKPEIQLAIASPTRTVPVEKHTVSVEQAETETVGKNTDSVSEATAITGGLLAQSEQETQRREQYAKTDGKAVAETLAALTLLHDQGVLSDKDYMQKQREIINEHTRKTQASLAGDVLPDSGAEANMSGVGSSTTIEPTSEKRFRVALFPIVSNSGSTFDLNDVVLYDYAHEYIRKHPEMALVFSAYDSRSDWDAAGTAANVWTGGFTKKIPDESSVVSVTKRVGANVALLFTHKKRTGGWSSNDFVVDVYVMDIEKRKTYKMQGDELSYEKTIETALNRLLSTSSTVVAAGLATQATTTVPVSTPSESLPILTLTTVFAQQRLSSSEIRSAISGNTLSGKTERGSDFHVYHSPDGKMSGQARLAYYDDGTWEITDDGNYCRQWTSWRDEATDCFEMFRIGEDQFRLKAINYHYDSAFKIRKGDPQSLKGRI